MRERDHSEGCPAERIEHYTTTVVAPAPAVRGLGLGAGDDVLVVHCLDCGATRYLNPGSAGDLDLGDEPEADASDAGDDADLDGSV